MPRRFPLPQPSPRSFIIRIALIVFVAFIISIPFPQPAQAGCELDFEIAVAAFNGGRNLYEMNEFKMAARRFGESIDNFKLATQSCSGENGRIAQENLEAARKMQKTCLQLMNQKKANELWTEGNTHFDTGIAKEAAQEPCASEFQWALNLYEETVEQYPPYRDKKALLSRIVETEHRLAACRSQSADKHSMLDDIDVPSDVSHPKAVKAEETMGTAAMASLADEDALYFELLHEAKALYEAALPEIEGAELDYVRGQLESIRDTLQEQPTSGEHTSQAKQPQDASPEKLYHDRLMKAEKHYTEGLNAVHSSRNQALVALEQAQAEYAGLLDEVDEADLALVSERLDTIAELLDKLD